MLPTSPSLLYLVYLRCFPDLTQQTPPFLLFLLPIPPSLLLLPTIPSHLLLQLGTISGGESPAVQFQCCCVRSHLHRELTEPAFKWSWVKKNKVTQSFDRRCSCVVLCLKQAPGFFSSVFCLLFIHLSIFSPLGGLRARLHSSSSVPNFLKFQFLAPVQENEACETRTRYMHR